MMRFCTSRSSNTITTSTRFSESPTNSICEMWATAGRGTVTTPASRVRFDSSCEALATIALGSAAGELPSARRSSSSGIVSGGRERSSVSTKNR